MRLRALVRIAACFAAMAFAAVAAAAIRLPAVIGDNMVLQRGQPATIWGWAEKHEQITVQIAGQTHSTKAGDDGRWKVVLDRLEPGQPLEMIVKGSISGAITLKHILVGEVWLASGQSNMGMQVANANNAKAEIAAAQFPQIRLITVPCKGTQVPQADFQGRWAECSPKTVGTCSAAAYFFGRMLHRELKTPVGIINCAWGASSCETWVRRNVLESDPRYKGMLEYWDQKMRNYSIQAEDAKWKKRLEDWQRQADSAKAAGKTAPPMPQRNSWDGPDGQQRPSNCYNGMVVPVLPYAIRGVIWYQGETNAGAAYQYRHLFPLMIRQWRDDWGQGDFPFLFVQLANFTGVAAQPTESAWAELREAQTMTLRTPNTGMAVTIDIGDAVDIHPKNKQDVGKRLAACALARVYGRDIVYSGPIYKSMESKDGRIALHFDHVGSGLSAKDGQPLTGFAIAGADRKFVWAEASIVGDTVVVHSPKVPVPAAVRYAWANNPACNFYNREGFPASPFRTDSWKGLTEKP